MQRVCGWIEYDVMGMAVSFITKVNMTAWQLTSWSQDIRHLLDSLTVSLHSLNGRHLPAVKAVQGDCQWENVGNSHRSHEPTIHCDWGNPNLYLDQPITIGWCQPVGGHVSYLTDSPDATRLGLCSSLVVSKTAMDILLKQTWFSQGDVHCFVNSNFDFRGWRLKVTNIYFGLWCILRSGWKLVHYIVDPQGWIIHQSWQTV